MPLPHTSLTFYQQLYSCLSCSGARSGDGVLPFVQPGPGQTIPVSHFGSISTAKIWLVPVNPKGDRKDSNVGFLPKAFASRSAITQVQTQETFDHFSAYFQRPLTHQFFSPWIQLLEGIELGGKPQSWFTTDNDENGGVCALDLVKCPTVKDWGSFVRQRPNQPDKKLIYLNCFEDAGPGRFLKRQINLHRPRVLLFADTASYLTENRLVNKDSDLFHLWPNNTVVHRSGVWTFGSPAILSIGLGAVAKIRAASPSVLNELRDTIQTIIRSWESRITGTAV